MSQVAAIESHGLSLEPTNLPRMALPGPLLSIVVPTFNEKENLVELVNELARVLKGIDWEVIFVDDDSPDETAKAARELACQSSCVRCIQRIGRRGLSSACVEGILGSSAPFLAVMDGDLQHDPAILPKMLDILVKTDCELVVGSRYIEGGGLGSWTKGRKRISHLATTMSHAIVPASMTDPMSGFFMLRRSLFDDVVRDLSSLGFKILLDIFSSAHRPVSFREVPFEFRSRHAGESKLDSFVVWEYLMLLGDKLFGKYVPVRFMTFALVGALGVGVHLSFVAATHSMAGMDFVASQTAGTVVAIVFNYSLNNVLTYRDRRRKGLRWLTGLLSFMAICSVGAIANIGIAAYLFDRQSQWVLASIAGILTGAVWNYAVSSVYTWGRPKS